MPLERSENLPEKNAFAPGLSDRGFNRLRDFIHDVCGIDLPLAHIATTVYRKL